MIWRICLNIVHLFQRHLWHLIDKLKSLPIKLLYIFPYNNHLFGQRWRFVGSFGGPTMINNVDSMFCSSDQFNCQRLALYWSFSLSQTRPECANVVPTGFFFQVSGWANVGPRCFKCTSYYWFVRKKNPVDSPYVLLLKQFFRPGSLERHSISIYSNELVLHKKRFQWLFKRNKNLITRESFIKLHIMNVWCVIKKWYRTLIVTKPPLYGWNIVHTHKA